jgi:hypothetical protein
VDGPFELVGRQRQLVLRALVVGSPPEVIQQAKPVLEEAASREDAVKVVAEAGAAFDERVLHRIELHFHPKGDCLVEPVTVDRPDRSLGHQSHGSLTSARHRHLGMGDLLEFLNSKKRDRDLVPAAALPCEAAVAVFERSCASVQQVVPRVDNCFALAPDSLLGEFGLHAEYELLSHTGLLSVVAPKATAVIRSERATGRNPLAPGAGGLGRAAPLLL